MVEISLPFTAPTTNTKSVTHEAAGTTNVGKIDKLCHFKIDKTLAPEEISQRNQTMLKETKCVTFGGQTQNAYLFGVKL